jgi:hypothetical protein
MDDVLFKGNDIPKLIKIKLDELKKMLQIFLPYKLDFT